MNKLTRFFSFSVVVMIFGLLAACSQSHNPDDIQSTGTPTAALMVQSDDVSLEILHVERLASYQTHYMMYYPPEGDDFVRIDARVTGTTDPETWLRGNVTIQDDGALLTPVHVRRVLIGEGYEYRADEDFKFHYQLFFSTSATSDLGALVLAIDGQNQLPLAELYPPTDDRVAPKPVWVPGEFSVVAGGSSNQALATHTTVSGGEFNRASVAYATVGGGRENSADFLYATIAGGYGNHAAGRESTIAGGSRNTIEGDHAVVCGGIRNQANGSDSVIAGGAYNLTGDVYAAIGGGTRNRAEGTAAAIAGGSSNEAIGSHASITGGLGNQAYGNYSAVLGGHQNSSNGDYSLALGGLANHAEGAFSTAIGYGSHIAVEHAGSFLYADSSAFPFESQNPDEFAIRATGGVRMVSAIDLQGAPVAGVVLPGGSGSWETLSTRSAKINFQTIETDQILNSLMELPIYTWSYRSETGKAVHIGPTAEDFHSEFNFGGQPTSIATVDADGVALAALQEIGHRLANQQQMIDHQDEKIEHIQGQLIETQQAISRLQTINLILLGLIVLLGSGGLKSALIASSRRG